MRAVGLVRDPRIVRGRHSPEKVELARQARHDPTPTEGQLWSLLRAGRLDGLHFWRQQIEAGFIADFYSHARKLIVEVDGNSHADRGDYERECGAILSEYGLRILRVSANEVDTDINQVLQQIRAAARQYGALAMGPSLRLFLPLPCPNKGIDSREGAVHLCGPGGSWRKPPRTKAKSCRRAIIGLSFPFGDRVPACGWRGPKAGRVGLREGRSRFAFYKDGRRRKPLCGGGRGESRSVVCTLSRCGA